MKVERIDDLGVLAGIIRSTRLEETVDSHFPVHGNWDGPRMGRIVSCWLLYILSEADHRLSHVESWAAGRIKTLRVLLHAPELEPRHLYDQRLELMLDYFSDEELWSAMLCSHVQNLLRVYPMNDGEVRLDAMITQSYRKIGELFQRGHSKHHNPKLPQLKEMVAVAGQFALPIATEIVAGNRADDQLYLQAAAKASKALGDVSGLLFVGDGKMSSLETRRTLNAQGNMYLCPLPVKHFTEQARRQDLEAGPTQDKMTKIWSEAQPKKKAELKVYGFSTSRQVSAKEDDTWDEQLIYVCSVDYRKAQLERFHNTLARAEEKLEDLLTPKAGRKAIKDPAELAQRVKAILAKDHTEAFLEVTTSHQCEVRQIKGRAGKPDREERSYRFSLECQRRTPLIEAHERVLGWQVYATNCAKLSFEQAVMMYHGQYRIEHRFDQLLNRTLHLQPMYLKLENRVCALIRLLVLALQFCAIIEYQVRTTLADTPELPDVKGLYPGHPGRKTRKPTSTMLLGAFRGVSLVFHTNAQGAPAVTLDGLTVEHEYLLHLAGIGPDFYQRITQDAVQAEMATLA